MNKQMAAVLFGGIVLSTCAVARPPLERGGDACDPSRYPPHRFHVAIDRDSGLTFIQSPCGWTFIGVVARESIDDDIRMSGARSVPVAVLRAEIAKHPELARNPPTARASRSTGRQLAAAGAPPR